MLRSFWLMFVLIGDVSKVANNCQSPVTSFDNYLFLFLAATLRYSVLQRKNNRSRLLYYITIYCSTCFEC
jgi:hypothetical protein